MKYICEHCRNQVTDSQKYCHECGSLFDQEESIEVLYNQAVKEFGIKVDSRSRYQNRAKNFLADLYDIIVNEGKTSGDFKFRLDIVKAALRDDTDKIDDLMERFDPSGRKSAMVFESIAEKLGINITNLEDKPFDDTIKAVVEGIKENFVLV